MICLSLRIRIRELKIKYCLKTMSGQQEMGGDFCTPGQGKNYIPNCRDCASGVMKLRLIKKRNAPFGASNRRCYLR